MQNLQQFGLTKNESEIYTFLLKHGHATTGPIISHTKIANSRVYESLKSLTDKGLVTYTIQKNGKHFQATSPQKLLELEEERKKKLEEIIPDLEKIQNTSDSKTTSAVYEGFEGFKTAFKKIIDDCPEHETIYIIGFSEQLYKEESLRLFLKNMSAKSIAKKHKMKFILDSSLKDKPLGKDREEEKQSEVRYMPKGYISPTAIDIFQDYVYIFLWDKSPFAFMIKNQKIADSFKQYHSFLWKIAKPNKLK